MSLRDSASKDVAIATSFCRSAINTNPIINVKTEYNYDVNNNIRLRIEGQYLRDGKNIRTCYISEFHNIKNNSRIVLEKIDHEFGSMPKIVIDFMYVDIYNILCYVFYPIINTTEFDIDITIGEKYPIVKLNGIDADKKYNYGSGKCVIM
jgi:hypothetical protein